VDKYSSEVTAIHMPCIKLCVMWMNPWINKGIVHNNSCLNEEKPRNVEQTVDSQLFSCGLKEFEPIIHMDNSLHFHTSYSHVDTKKTTIEN